MSSPLTPFQTMQQLNTTSVPGLYNAGCSVDDDTPTSTVLGLGPSTPFDEYSLLSPLDIVSPINNTFRASHGSLGHETSAYIQLLQQQNTLLRNELRKEKETNIKLMAGNNKLIEAHNRLSEYLGPKNRPHLGPEFPSPLQPATQATPRAFYEEEESKPPVSPARVQSRSECPNIKYWTKKEWTDAQSAKKNSSDPADQPGARGRSRCAQGENVSAKYLEGLDGIPISGTDAANIREYARSIWCDFDKKGAAPRKWSNAPRSLQDEYIREMEAEWKVLRYCENHWKAHQVATSNYPQWYKNHISSKPDGTKGPAEKKRKVDDDDAQTASGEHDTDHESDADRNGSDSDTENKNPSPSLLEGGIRQEKTTAVPSRPKARPILHPLANALDQINKTFRLSKDSPNNIIQAGRPVNHNQRDDTNDAMNIDYNIVDKGEANVSNLRTNEALSTVTTLPTPCIAPVPVSIEATRPTPMQGPGVSPVSYVPTPMLMQGPGVAVPVSIEATRPTPMQGPGVSPVSYVPTPMLMQGPGVAVPVSIEATRPTPMQGPGVSPISSVPTRMLMQGPGVAPVSYVPITPTQLPNTTIPNVSVAPMQGPGIPPTTTPSSSTMRAPSPGPSTPSTTEVLLPGPSAPSMMEALLPGPSAPSTTEVLSPGTTKLPPDSDEPNASSRQTRSSKRKLPEPRRFTDPGKMTPQPGISAWELCSRDWCEAHPEGTIAEFHNYWANLDKGLVEEYNQKEAARIAEIRASGHRPRRRVTKAK